MFACRVRLGHTGCRRRLDHGFLDIDTFGEGDLYGFKVMLVQRDPAEVDTWLPDPDVSWTSTFELVDGDQSLLAETESTRPSSDTDEAVPMSAQVTCDDSDAGGGTYEVDGTAVDVVDVRCESDGFYGYEGWAPNASGSLLQALETESFLGAPEAVGAIPYGDDDGYLLYAASRSDDRDIAIRVDVAERPFVYRDGRAISTPAAAEHGLSFDLQCGMGPPPDIDASLGS